MRPRWAAVVLFCSACGSFGTAENGTPGDGVGSSDASVMKGDAAASFCEVKRRDPTVKKCIDFDEKGSQTAPTFGFDEISHESNELLQLGPSFLDGQGSSLVVGLRNASSESLTLLGRAHLLKGSSALMSSRITLDVDIIIDEMSLDYAALASVGVAGKSCGVYQGLAASRAGFRRMDAPDQTIYPLKLNAPFHFRLSVSPKPGQSTSTEMSVDGESIASGLVAYDATCDYAAVVAGAFWTSKNQGDIRVRYDQIVVRVE